MRGETHTARLVCIEPIVRDSLEQIVRDLSEWGSEDVSHALGDLIKRARKLLGDAT